jgi:SAM-dependent methyltransferase
MCPICHGNETIGLYNSRDRIYNIPGIFTVYHCSRCYAVFYEPQLTEEELSTYYPDGYSRYRYSKSLDRKNYNKGLRRFVLENYYGYPSSKGYKPSLFKKGFAFLFSFVVAKGAIHYQGEGKLLDVGCGGGSHLYRFRNWGWKTFGVEPSEKGVKLAKELGLNVFHGELTDACFPDDFFDVIQLKDVLEHLVKPHMAMNEIKRILKPDGVVYITMPNTRGPSFWLFGENWFNLEIPRHVISYSPRALEFLCNATGFEIVEIRFDSGAFNFVRSVQFFLEEKGRHWPGWFHRINWHRNKLIRRTLKPLFLLADLLRFGDVMVATLRKGVSSES